MTAERYPEHKQELPTTSSAGHAEPRALIRKGKRSEQPVR